MICVPAKQSSGFTLVEAMISVVIVAVMLSAAMTTVSMSGKMQYRGSDRARGAALADGLMWEIMQQSYEDPVNSVLFGREIGESSTSRAAWNDVDDYNGLSESPPQNKDGTTIANMTGWTRSVTVAWVTSANINTTSIVETSAKRIVVTVKHGNIVAATRTAVRTKAP